MNRLASLCALLLMGSLSSFGSSNLHDFSSQGSFHFPPAGARAAKAHAVAKKQSSNDKADSRREANAKLTGASKPSVKPATANPPIGKLGLVSATDIPAGGGNYWYSQTLLGDFNGDGKKDVVLEVENYVSASWVYSVSVVLSNGDGTFQPAALTPIPSNDSCAQIAVGDVNGDKKDDILIVHGTANCGGGNSNVDVLLSNGDGTFTVGSNFPVSSYGLAGGTLADVNGDGKLDIVAVDQNGPAGVWTLLGNGDGTFQAATSVALSGAAGNYASLVDVNGDGLLDVVDLDYGSRQLTVYIATSATSYASAVSSATSDQVYDGCSMTVGDMTSDAKPEIVTANCGTNNLTVYVNNGDGSFHTGVYYAAGLSQANGTAGDLYPESVAIADVNGDGKADLISSNDDTSDVTILLGNGDGTVNVPTTGYATGGYPQAPAVIADFNGDGFTDIMVADREYSVVYLKGYGDGTFRAALNYYSPIPASTWGDGFTVASGDFNGDGYPDFALGNCCNYSLGVTVFLSRPDGSLQPGVDYVNPLVSNSDLRYVAVADVNKDGKLDIVVEDANNRDVQIFTGAGDGTFTVGSTFASDTQGGYPGGVVMGDYNGDGFQDIAIANSNDGGEDVAILLNDGTGNLLAPVTYSLSSSFNTIQMAAADLNGDGKLDLIVPLTYAQTVAILLGNGDGTFQAEADVAIPVAYPFGATVADFNGDGKADLAVTLGQWQTSGIVVALGNGDGTFQTPALLASTLQNQLYDSPYTSYIQAVDIDGDGKQDLVYTNAEYGTVGILYGLGTGSFYDPVEFPSGGFAWGLAIADVNQDGALDVVTAGDDFSGLTVLLNAGGSGTQSNYSVAPDITTATVSAGGSATFMLTLTPANHYNGVVTLSCGTLPAYTTCTFNPPTVTMDGHTPVTVQLTITTTSVSASAEVPADVNPHHGSAILMASLSGLGLCGIVFAAGSKKRNRYSAVLLALLAVSMTMGAVGCGKDCEDSPSACKATSTPAAAATTTTVASSQNPVVAGTAVAFNAAVSASSGTPIGTLTFLDGTTQLGTGTLVSGKASFQTTSLTAGTHSITVSYAGNSSFKASTSSALTQTIDHPGTPAGTYTVPVNAVGTAGSNSGNTFSHSLNVTLIVQ
jgi:Bacterial Ig-like domain (group 3)/FG-GAP-like repeat